MRRIPFTRSRLACAIAGGLLLTSATPHALAFQFDLRDGEIAGRLDTTLSVGAMWRTEGRDRELAANGDPVEMAMKGYSTQLNKNDGNMNFDTGLASLVYKITPELSLNWNDRWGVLVRGTAWYDSVIMDEGRDGGRLTHLGVPVVGAGGVLRYASYSDHANNGTGERFNRDARRYAGQRERILDAYVWTSQELFDRPLDLRIGQQVISWGEALFLQNGINSANFFDLNALRLPGSEIKEALLPLDSLYFSYGLTDNLTMEGFYQFEWKNSEDAAAGTFFSTNDAYPAWGADNVIVDGRLVAYAQGMPALAQAFANYTLSTYGPDYEYEYTQVTVDRRGDEEASDNGQFGVGFRYFADQLNGTEFGFFYTRTHAKLPVVGARATQLDGIANLASNIDNTQYWMAYPEKVDMFGVSFNSMIGGVSVAGEVSYRPKLPIINEIGDTLISQLALLGSMDPNDPNPAARPTVGHLTGHCVRASLDSSSCLATDTLITENMPMYFFDYVESVNASLVSIFNFGPKFGTDSLMALVEVGVDHIASRNDHADDGSRLCYNSTAGMRADEAAIQSPDDVTAFCMDETSWGYRGVLMAEYNDIFAGISMKPSISVSHDVSGNSHIGGNFMQNRKAATLGVTFAYLNGLELSAQATSFWGGGFANKLSDRNNASVALKYSF